MVYYMYACGHGRDQLQITIILLQVEKNFEKIVNSRNGAAKSNETR